MFASSAAQITRKDVQARPGARYTKAIFLTLPLALTAVLGYIAIRG